MNDIRADQLATIHRLASDFIAKLEADGFHRSAIASVLTALGINLATSCNDPGALALVIEAALREMSPRREKANSLMKKSALDGDPDSVEELSNELGRARAAERPDDRSKGEEDEVAVERVQYQAAASGTPPPSETPPSADPPAPAATPQLSWPSIRFLTPIVRAHRGR